MNKLFIVGKNSYFTKRFIEKNSVSKREIVYTSTKPGQDDLFLDLNSPEEFDYPLVDKNDLVAVVAAVSSPDICNNDYDKAYNVNVKGTMTFIEKSLARQAKVVFFSSDTVYGETKDECNENSKINPFGVYAKMKVEVENRFLENNNFKVFRVSYMFSKNDKFSKYLSSCSLKKEKANVFHPLCRRIVFIDDVVEALSRLPDNWENFSQNIFNITGSEFLSKKDFVELYKQEVDKGLEYDVVEPDENFFKCRPRYINMGSLYLESLLGRKQILIKDAIKQEFNKS